MNTNAKTLGYWATTGLLSFALLGGGFGKLSGADPMVQSMEHLGFPVYLLTILGFWYVAAVPALLAPGFARLKEWAYAGVIFAMTGAFASHVLAGDPISAAAPTVVLAALAVTSYALRPEARRVAVPAPAAGVNDVSVRRAAAA